MREPTKRTGSQDVSEGVRLWQTGGQGQSYPQCCHPLIPEHPVHVPAENVLSTDTGPGAQLCSKKHNLLACAHCNSKECLGSTSGCLCLFAQTLVFQDRRPWASAPGSAFVAPQLHCPSCTHPTGALHAALSLGLFAFPFASWGQMPLFCCCHTTWVPTYSEGIVLCVQY